jgi:hypothetical protein
LTHLESSLTGFIAEQGHNGKIGVVQLLSLSTANCKADNGTSTRTAVKPAAYFQESEQRPAAALIGAPARTQCRQSGYFILKHRRSTHGLNA